MQTFTYVFTTMLLGLAVKQLSYSLLSGSLFQPLRSGVYRGMTSHVPGFRILNELLTCKLCVTMQVSLWFIMIPGILIGHISGLPSVLLGEPLGGLAEAWLLVLSSFLYAAAVSGIALGIWIFLEYPAKRYEDAMHELNTARQAIEDLRALCELSGTKLPPARIGSVKGQPVLPFTDFRQFMESVNARCDGNGCGYSRRTCRTEAVSDWLSNWAAGNFIRFSAVPKIKLRLGKLLPDYFRRYSDHDTGIENERAFARLHQEVVAGL